MDFNEYQERIKKFDTFSPVENAKEPAFSEKIMGLAGEAGETVDKFKKIIRDKDGVISDEDQEEIAKELGDVLWYVASLSRYLNVPLSEVAEKNVEKLESRLERNQLHGSGDNR